jgi:hypothetical protein
MPAAVKDTDIQPDEEKEKKSTAAGITPGRSSLSNIETANRSREYSLVLAEFLR